MQIDTFLTETKQKTFPDGTPRYNERTDEERAANCRKPYGVGINESGILYIKRELPCHVFSLCQSCREYRGSKRREMFSRRLENVDAGLYKIETKTETEHRRIRQQCNYHGLDYISVPTTNGEERFTIVNGEIPNSSPISTDEAKRRLSWYSPLITTGRVSGKLGLDEKGGDNRIGDTIVELSARDLIYTTNKKPTPVEIAIANVKVARLTPSKIDENLVQRILEIREDAYLNVLSEMGIPCHFSRPKKKKFNLNSIKRQWLSIENAQYRIGGEIVTADDYTRQLMCLVVDGENAKIDRDSFFSSVDKMSAYLK